MKKLLIAFVMNIAFFMSTSYAQINITFDPATAYQGKTFVADINDTGTYKEISATFLGTVVPLYKKDDHFRGIFGVKPAAPVGPQKIEITATKDSGEIDHLTADVLVKPTKFKAEKLFFPPGKQDKLVAQKISDDQEKVASVMERASDEQLWSGKFLVPIKGRITSPYGAYRLYNGKRIADHRGTDIGGNPTGTPIHAANSGVVAFAQLLPTIGSTLIIDHGQGIFSIYMHMSKTLVAVGERIEKGQIVGRVGSTGLSTGPHLHWGLSVHNVRVNAFEWANRLVAE
ncbi:MAG: M23 family metallopeptidase [Candidatus Margulisiibacteriota bacterium]